jgi:hypothetical protein
LTVDEAEVDDYLRLQAPLIDRMRQKWVIGDAEQAARKLLDLAAEFDVDEVMINPVAGAYQDTPVDQAPGREKTLRLLAEATSSRPASGGFRLQPHRPVHHPVVLVEADGIHPGLHQVGVDLAQPALGIALTGKPLIKSQLGGIQPARAALGGGLPMPAHDRQLMIVT